MAEQANQVRVAPPPLPTARSSVLPWICLGGTVFLVAVFATVLIWQVISNPRATKNLASNDKSSDKHSASDRDQLSDSTAADAVNSSASENQPPIAVSSSNPDPAGFQEVPVTKVVNPPVERTAITGNSKRDEASPVFEDLRRQDFQLQLPACGVEIDLEQIRLASIPLNAEDSIQLKLLSNKHANLSLVPDGGGRPDDRAWNVIKQVELALGTLEEVRLGQFRYSTGELRFQWQPQIPQSAKPGSLQFVPLEIKVGSDRCACLMWKPVSSNPVQINTKGITSAEVPFSASLIDRLESFRIAYQLVDPASSTAVVADVTLNQSGKLKFGAEPGIEADVEFSAGDDHSSLQIRLFATPPSFKNSQPSVRQEITTEFVAERLKQTKAKDPKRRENDIARLQSQKAKLEKAGSNANRNGGGFDPAEKQVESLDAKIAKLEEELAGQQQVYESNLEWCQKVSGLLRQLEDRTPLYYAIYRETEPRIRILETAGFDWSRK